MLRKLVAVGVLAVLVGAGVGASSVLSSASSVSTCQSSVDEALLASRITGKRQSYKSDNPLEFQSVSTYLNGGTRPDTTGMTHMGLHLVYLEDTCRGVTTTTSTTTTTTTTTTQPPPPGCTQTISSGLSSAIQNAAAGSTICLNTASYGNVSLTDVSKVSDVLVQPSSGATVTIGFLSWNNVDHVHFSGLGGTMRVGGMDLDPSSGNSTNDTWDHITWTSGVTFYTRGNGNNLVLDSSVLDNLPVPGYEGRVTVRGFSNSAAVGVTISNNHFAGGCSDGVQVIGDANGVQIGPGNEFTNIHQSGCDPVHVDPIQFYGAVNTQVIGNYFHDNGDGSGGLGSFDGDSPATVRNNVFVCTCAYPPQLTAGSARNWLIEHNVMAGGGDIVVRENNGAGAVSGNTLRDNVFLGGGGYSVDSGFGSASYSLNGGLSGTGNINGTPVFVGGSNPTTWAGYVLAANSPGYHAGHDGSSMGIVP